ncbi:flagellar basal-body MS-ring/collar protein FliF [Fuerstiella marisgermanici]|uniref:Flagellar M-ring protein n=1 Tax=Fuerstiella marisgermanici TaxID=1891926 RepID=A0A1P8WJ75_9PLAN|nr:flagellar basal-body MS-ring/collar protein FliF [Fuerstiella marisgermanici]APZ94119.1 Flagellar M-ring protein [Fuerstiella marisgermanici]
MAFLKTLIEQLKDLWGRWTIAQRVGISAATVACVAGIVGTMFWATRPDYVALVNQLTPQRAAEFIAILESEQITYELNYSGSAISVPRSSLNVARVALQDVWEPTVDDGAGMSGAFPGSPREEDERRRRQLETRIAQTLSRIHGVRSATVHISQPSPSPFVNEQTPSTASIIVDPTSAGSITMAVAEGIISTVARAVEGLAPDKITLMDTAGRQFNAADGIGSTMDGQFDYQQRVELRLASKAESMLGMLLGHGKAVVRVSADIDFRETTRTDRKLDPDSKVKRTETIETVSQTGGVTPNGEVGVNPNIQVPNFDGDEGVSYKKELISADYDNASTEEIVRDIPGKITRLTIAAIVDVAPPAADPAAADDAAAAPTPNFDAAQIEAIVKQAVGFDEVRGDEIQVMTADLTSGLPADEIPGVMAMWNEYEPMIQTVGMGLIATMAFLMGFLLLRKMKPVVVTETATEQQLSLDEVRHMAALSEQAKSNPEVAAKILSAWLGEDEEDLEAELKQGDKRAA